jgi:DNA-binding HxlR family transcriptional regulator
LVTVNRPFRIFLLEYLLNYSERQSWQIWHLVRSSYKIEKISQQYLNNTLRRMHMNGEITRIPIKEQKEPGDQSRYIYAITENGRKRLSYYKSLQ